MMTPEFNAALSDLANALQVAMAALERAVLAMRQLQPGTGRKAWRDDER